jgi:hypothetical protein
MLALVIVLLAVAGLLCVVVTGLLRSHADIVRALHSLGVGLGDPATEQHDGALERPVTVAGPGVNLPPLPAERSSAVHELQGVTPAGEAVVVSMSSSTVTLLAFLSSGCDSCAPLWASVGDERDRDRLPPGTRVVVVTKGPEWESPALIAAKAPRGIAVVMSTDAWGDYEVPGSPYFVLVDGRTRTRIGEGVGHNVAQIADLVGRAAADERDPASAAHPGTPSAEHNPSQSHASALGLTGVEREAHNDAVLRSAGILPGDPSLYPRRFEDVFVATGPARPTATEGPVDSESNGPGQPER